jgi:hypothetical protein
MVQRILRHVGLPTEVPDPAPRRAGTGPVTSSVAMLN